MLCDLRYIFDNYNGKCIAGFNVYGYEDAAAVISAACTIKCPVILMVNVPASEHMPVPVIGVLLAKMAETAEAAGVIILHENEKDIYGDVASRCKDIFDNVKSPALRGVFDPANFVQCGQVTYPDAFELLKPHIVYMHIKDAFFEDGKIVPAKTPVISAQCLRVPVTDGHIAAVFMNLKTKVDEKEIIRRWESYEGEPQKLGLPSAPKQFIRYMTEDNRPQVTLDVDYERGMGVSIGRLREDTVYDWKFVGLSHNTVRGAAGGAVLCAELLKAKGFIAAK